MRDTPRGPLYNFPVKIARERLYTPERCVVAAIETLVATTPFLGTGEAAQGPAAAALANAVADATGMRFRELPLTRRRVATAFAEIG